MPVLASPIGSDEPHLRQVPADAVEKVWRSAPLNKRGNPVRPERFELEAFCGRERSGSPQPKS